MRLKFLRVARACTLLLIVAYTASAQPFRQLTVYDFRSAPLANSRGVVAYTNCSINFSYQASVSNNVYRLNFNVNLTLNRDRSWIDRSRITSKELLTEILKHEQGHYNIAYLEQQEVIRAMTRTRFTSNYRQEAMDIFNRIDARYKQLNIDYDEDTQHMQNRQQQRSWDIYFNKRLEYMPPENASL
jgi:predicted secreted Zn-dependent protease